MSIYIGFYRIFKFTLNKRVHLLPIINKIFGRGLIKSYFCFKMFYANELIIFTRICFLVCCALLNITQKSEEPDNNIMKPNSVFFLQKISKFIHEKKIR